MNVLHNGIHCFGLRIYFHDTDAGGIVYHANYLHFAERGRSETMRFLGVPHVEMISTQRRMFVVRHANLEFFCPARLDDWLVVRSHIVAISAAQVTFDQTISRDDQTIVRIDLRLACIDADSLRAARVPPQMRAALERMRVAGM
jgi:acyl-CoA thioester hydrolase